MSNQHWLYTHLKEWESMPDNTLCQRGSYDNWHFEFSYISGEITSVIAEYHLNDAYARGLELDASWDSFDECASELMSKIKKTYPHIAPLSPQEKDDVIKSMIDELDKTSNVENPYYTTDPPNDAPEDNETVSSVVLRSWWMPEPVKQLVWDRLEFGVKKYGVPLRTGWDKADQYLKDEEGDMVAYLLAGGYTKYAVFLSWAIFLRRLWLETVANPLNGGRE